MAAALAAGLAIATSTSEAALPFAARSATRFPIALTAVSADSATDGWAVGQSSDGSGMQTAHILHWSGRRWSQSTIPTLCCRPTFSELLAVSAQSPTNAWAVGAYGPSDGTGNRILVLHWNGKRWTQLPGAMPSSTVGNSALYSVSADSPTDAWAVGVGDLPLTLHWDGKHWRRIKNGARPGAVLQTVAAQDPRHAWAAGIDLGSSTAVVLRWNGTNWSQVHAPVPSSSTFAGISASPTGAAWAVGDYLDPTGSPLTLTEHWVRSRWLPVLSPNPGGTSTAPRNTRVNELTAISAADDNDAWAVGLSASNSGQQPVILHWTGSQWLQVASGVTGDLPSLSGVSTLSNNDAWAVGWTTGSSGSQRALILRWNGLRWRPSVGG